MSGDGPALTRRLALGGLASAALAWGLPDGGDALRGVLVAAPLAVSLLACLPVRPLAGARSGRHQTTAAAALILAGLAWPGLGLRYGEALAAPAVVAGLYLVLAWAVGERLAAVVRGAAAERGERTSRDLALLALAVYLAVLPWSTGLRPPDGDEPYYLLLTHSLAYDFDADLADNYARQDSLRFMPRAIAPQEGDPTGPDGEIYSRHGITLPLLLAPAYRLGGKLAALAVMAVLAALLVGSLARLARLYFPAAPRGAAIAAAAAGLSPPLLLYSHQAWVEVPAALLVAQGLIGALEVERGRPPTRGAWLRLAAAAALLPALKIRFLLVSVPLLGLALLRAPERMRRHARWALIGAGAAGAALMLYNQAVFGKPLRNLSVGALLDQIQPPTAYLRAPFGLLFDCAFGLFLTAPIWILLVPAAVEIARRHRRYLADSLVVCLPYLLVLAPRQGWYGSWSPPFRYGVVLLPFLALALVPVLARRRALRHPMVLLLAGSTVALALVWLLIPGWTYNLADGRSHLLDHLTRLAGGDVARLFPSQLRPRTANAVWALALPALALLGWRAGWRCRGRRAAQATVASVLILALPAVLLAARRLPLRIVEFEDPYVAKSGGQLYPELWFPMRSRLAGGWSLGPGDEVEVRIGGGGRMRMTLRLRNASEAPGSVPIELLRGEEVLARLEPRPGPLWSEHRLPWLDWPAPAPLRLRIPREAGGGVILDRASLAWTSRP